MCFISLTYKVIPDYPVVVAANRDEYYDRPGSAPLLWQDGLRFAAPRDPRGGGTWLGCNEAGIIVAVTNRRGKWPNPDLRSRGLLVVELLRIGSACRMQAALEKNLATNRYNPFNLLAVGPEYGFVAHYDGRLRQQEILPGVHAIAEGDINDPGSSRVGRAHQLTSQILDEEPKGNFPRQIARLTDSLQVLCADHETSGEPTAALCVHGEQGGTLSSSIIAWAREPAKRVYLHSQGTPCTTPFFDFSQLIRF